MTVLVCGPEGSGTHILHAVVTDYIKVPAIHRSLPDAGKWWDDSDPQTGDPWPKDTRRVIIVRRPDVTTLALLGRKPPLAVSIGESRDNRRRAMEILSAMPDPYWLYYEALVLNPRQQADNLARWLGVVPSGQMPQIRDENAKWLSVLER